MAPTILQGTNAVNNFILGKSGEAYGSSTGEADDSVIFDLSPGKDIVSLAGTKDDYLIRPTSLPYDINGYQKYATTAVAIFLTDRTKRVKVDLAGGFTEGNEITPIAFIVPPRSWKDTFENWIKALGLSLDTDANKPIDDYRKRAFQVQKGGEPPSPSNYYTSATSTVFRFDNGTAPTRSSSPGQVIPLTGYSLAPSKAAINEGETLTTTVKTTGVLKDTIIYWEITGSGVDANDFVAAANTNPLRGEGKVDANGELKFSRTLKNDLTLNEGDETLQVKLYSASSRTPASQVGTNLSIKVNDTSKRTYALTPSKAAINEGETLTTTIKTTGVLKDTIIYWEITGSGVDANDFVATANTNPLRGEGKVDAKGELKFSRTLKNDLTLNEGDETLQIKVYTDSARKTNAAATTAALIKDTSSVQQKAFQSIYSDKVYSAAKPNTVTNALYSEGENKAYADAITGINYELEFGAKAIAATLTINAADDTRNGRWTPSETRRIVFLGEFAYDKNGIVSADVKEIAAGGVGVRGKDIYYFGIVKKPAKAISGNWNNLDSWSSLWENATNVVNYDKNPLSSTGELAEFMSFGGGKFFYDGWQSNPFASNLI